MVFGDVEAFEETERQLVNRFGHVGLFECRFVEDDRLAVAGNAEIEQNLLTPLRQTLINGGQRVFRRVKSPAPMDDETYIK